MLGIDHTLDSRLGPRDCITLIGQSDPPPPAMATYRLIVWKGIPAESFVLLHELGHGLGFVTLIRRGHLPQGHR